MFDYPIGLPTQTSVRAERSTSMTDEVFQLSDLAEMFKALHNNAFVSTASCLAKRRAKTHASFYSHGKTPFRSQSILPL
jgi:hypothetical protein